MHRKKHLTAQERIPEGLMFHLGLEDAKEKAGEGAVRGERVLPEQRRQPVRRQEGMEEHGIL